MNSRALSMSGKFTGWHFLAICVFCFGVVFAVNGYFIYEALSTFDGIEVDDAYQKGRAYNKVIDAMAAQKARGWQSKMAIEPGKGPQMTRLIVNLADKAGQPLDTLKVRATFWRPVAVGADQKAEMRQTGPGRYEADFHLPFDGNWIVRIAALDAKGERFAKEDRVFVAAR